jgi:hypothetical protein
MERGFHKRSEWHLDRVPSKEINVDVSAITFSQKPMGSKVVVLSQRGSS